MTPTVLAPPPRAARLLPARKDAPRPRLRQITRQANAVTDTELWFGRNGLSLPYLTVPDETGTARGNLPEGLPLTLAGVKIIAAYPQPKTRDILAVYGSDYANGRYLLAWSPTAEGARYAFDFQNYTTRFQGKETLTPILYAREEDRVLYVTNSVGGYARESGGNNAYVTALESKTGKLLWRSAPLTANANTLEIIGDVLISGYGFTAEPDYLYLLDKKTGQRLHRHRLKSAPEYILAKNNRLHIRCYDTDYVFVL